jgi:hypothetical protein
MSKTSNIQYQLDKSIQAEPVQVEKLSLFHPFIFNTESERKNLSNSIELWDSMPRYSISRQAMKKMRDSNGRLPVLQLEMEHRGNKYTIKIHPVPIEKTKNGGEVDSVEYYPSANEGLVEEVLRKFASDKNGFFIDERPKAKSGVIFSLYQLMLELKRCGHARSLNEIKDSLYILNRSFIQITQHNSDKTKNINFASSNYFPLLAGVTRGDLKMDSNAKWLVQFHPLVTESIVNLSYRQFNYYQMMCHSNQLTRWLHKLLVMKYIHAGRLNSFVIHYSTVKRDSSMLNYYSRARAAQDAFDFAMDELKGNNVLRDMDRKEKVGIRGKVLDIIYTVFPSNQFVKEAAVANLRNKKLSTTHGGILE